MFHVLDLAWRYGVSAAAIPANFCYNLKAWAAGFGIIAGWIHRSRCGNLAS